MVGTADELHRVIAKRTVFESETLEKKELSI